MDGMPNETCCAFSTNVNNMYRLQRYVVCMYIISYVVRFRLVSFGSDCGRYIHMYLLHSVSDDQLVKRRKGLPLAVGLRIFQSCAVL